MSSNLNTPVSEPTPAPVARPGLDSPLSTLEGGPGLVYSRLLELKRRARPLSKDNDFKVKNTVRYRYRGIDDLYNHLHELMGDIGILLVPGKLVEIKRATFETPPKFDGGAPVRSNHVALVQQYRWIAEDGSSVEFELPGEGIDQGDKTTGKGLSMAQKYAIVQSLNLPTGDPDPDAFETTGAPADTSAVRFAGDGPQQPNQRERAGTPPQHHTTRPAPSGNNRGPRTPTPKPPAFDLENLPSALMNVTTDDEVAHLQRQLIASMRTQQTTNADGARAMKLIQARRADFTENTEE